MSEEIPDYIGKNCILSEQRNSTNNNDNFYKDIEGHRRWKLEETMPASLTFADPSRFVSIENDSNQFDDAKDPKDFIG